MYDSQFYVIFNGISVISTGQWASDYKIFIVCMFVCMYDLQFYTLFNSHDFSCIRTMGAKQQKIVCKLDRLQMKRLEKE